MRSLALAALAFFQAVSAVAQARPDTVRAGRFDYGKMWLFENPPSAYFTETYGFAADDAWFERARGAALRVPGCSAAFVSPRGLVVTNHHCIRDAVFRLSRAGENLLEDGFYARTLQDERRIPDYFVDQLVAVEDVSAEVLAAVDAANGDEAKRAARAQAAAAARDRIARERNAQAEGLFVQVIPLYNGARYSAYTFRRYTDVRLVAAAEEQLAFFGGDPDNFTYPRYALDFGFLRVYGADGSPIANDRYFGWSEEGVEEGDAVFVIGNPGATNRLSTMAQLETRRDVLLPAQARIFDERIQAIWDFYGEDPTTGDELGLRNDAFSLSNSWKQYVGQLQALGDPLILARKRDAEEQLRDSIAARSPLAAAYGDVIDRIAALQPSYREAEQYYEAFLLWGVEPFDAALLRRAIVAAQIRSARASGVAPDSVAALQQRLLAIEDLPTGLERRLLAARLRDLATLPVDDPVRVLALGDDDPETAATRLLAESALASRSTLVARVDSRLDADPAVQIAVAVAPRLQAYTTLLQQIGAQEAELASRLGRARFEVYGTAVPPDGSSSPRITDGIVQGFAYNGTVAPPYTTFFGIYDRYLGHRQEADWSLPARWQQPPEALDLDTPLNFVSTADTYGGNSGSPAVTPDLALVGLNFDRNIDGLSRNFIYLPERGRNIMVDVRAIREALDDVYDADRIVLEVLTHQMYASEAEADAAAARTIR
ncbi:MAG: S46 family peptidase [Gemmatimonadales bacterium]